MKDYMKRLEQRRECGLFLHRDNDPRSATPKAIKPARLYGLNKEKTMKFDKTTMTFEEQVGGVTLIGQSLSDVESCRRMLRDYPEARRIEKRWSSGFGVGSATRHDLIFEIDGVVID